MWLHQAFIVCRVNYALRALLGTGCACAHVTVPDTSHNGIKRLSSCQQHQIWRKKKEKNFKQLSSVARAYVLVDSSDVSFIF